MSLQNGENSNDPYAISGKTQPRNLIRPQGTCGKWIYMSPEIYKNEEPFDGFAVDMWAAGVILFLMLTGFPPWERACGTDDRFKYMTAGYLVQMLTEWNVGLTSDAMDLLQRMLFIDPKDRLSLDQVRAHPWMVNGRREAPPGLF
jgi:serine/threonine protein kinase